MDSEGDRRALYLQEIDIKTTIKSSFNLELRVDDARIEIDRTKATSRWTPFRAVEISSTSQIVLVMKTGRFSFKKLEAKTDLSGQEIVKVFWNSKEREFSIPRDATFGNLPATVTFKFRPSDSAEATHEALQKLRAAMDECKPLMSDKVERYVDMATNYGLAISEINPFAKAAVSVVKVTVDLLKEQKKYDNMVTDLIDRIGRVIPFLQQVRDQNLSEDAKLLSEIITKTFALVMDTAKFVSEYVAAAALKRSAKSFIFTKDQERIGELTGALSKLVEDFDRGVGTTTLQTAKRTGSIDEHLYLESRLKPIVDARYNSEKGCMEGTRKAVLKTVTDWALTPLDRHKKSNTPNMFWLYGQSGVGKTSVAHSICSLLHDEKRLGGGFFCKQGHPDLGDSKNVLPTLVSDLAGTWRPYRELLTKKLKDDTMWDTRNGGDKLLSHLKELKKQPTHPLVLLVDGLDQFPESPTRASILKSLFDASSQHSWLRVIVVSSAPTRQIDNFFKRLDSTRYLSQDLGEDTQAPADIKLFAREQFSLVAATCHLAPEWPGQEVLDRIVARANGRFSYVEDILRQVKEEPDPVGALAEAMTEGSIRGVRT